MRGIDRALVRSVLLPANLILVALLLMISHRTNVVRGGSRTERFRLAELS